MPAALTESYSGVVFNQNVPPTGSYSWRSGWVYQTFYLPDNYILGSASSELRYPDLSGFQILVDIDLFSTDGRGLDVGGAVSASLNYTLDYYANGWVNLAQGTVVGSHADGSQVWMDVIFPQSVPVTSTMMQSVMRIGMAARAGINTLWYVTPNPLVRRPNVSSTLAVSVQQLSSQGQAYQADGITPLVASPSSINFRLLGLTADNGVDFLGNEYRSCVVQAAAPNTDTTQGVNPVTGNRSGPFWLSAPQPSRFAVVSQYLDMRPIPANPTISNINYIGNPNFEYDALGAAPAQWTVFAPATCQVRSNTVPIADPNYAPWVDQGTQVLQLGHNFASNTFNNTQGIYSSVYVSVKNIPQVTLSCRYNLITSNGAALQLNMLWYDASSTLLATTNGAFTVTPGIGTLSTVFNVPANAVLCRPTVVAVNRNATAAAAFSTYIDSIQMTLTPSVQPYFDGDTVGSNWGGQRGQSISVQYQQPAAQNTPVVLDGIYLDPITPNVAFHVYYSVDDVGTSSQMTEHDWEQKLWTRVPRVYVATQAQEYAFPTPIQAKYVKVEFTNLQSQSYTPGSFAAPIQYKKYPSWVANFFIGQMQQPSFVASLVNVEYDALNFAYNYFLDDLGQRPDAPVPAPAGSNVRLTDYFSTQSTTGVDSATLSQVDLVMKRFGHPVGSLTDPTLLGNYVTALVNSGRTATTYEDNNLTPVDYSTVSSLTREPVLFEQSLPVMYFFLPCRHTYKELSAHFDFNRAYFAGVNDLALIRHDYTIADDTPLYIESGADATNVDRSDFVMDVDNNWYCY